MNKIIETRFSGCLDVNDIRTKVTVKPEPVSRLESLDIMVAADVLSSTLKQIFIPNEFSLAFIKSMVGKASMHSQRLFASEAIYSSNVFHPPEVEVSPICLTGLAGVGKSQTIAALRKVLPPPMEFSCDLFDGSVPLTSDWYASARGKASGKALLEHFVFGDKKPAGKTTVAQLLRLARRSANTQGVSLVVLDETQYFNTGLGTAKVTDVLLTVAAIGPPTAFLSNYSLVHKLMTRNSEDKQRLLANPEIMLPDDPDSADWHHYITECIRVSNGAIDADTREMAAEIYRCTFGLKRLVVHILTLAYVECRNAGRYSVNLSDIVRAYRSIAYTVSAKEVETLQLLALGGKPKKASQDLVCPFELSDAMKSNVVKFARDDRHGRVIAKVFDSAMTDTERAAMKHLDEHILDAPKNSKPHRRASVVKLSADQQVTAFNTFVSTLATSKPKKPKQ
ncbi:AAA family ATPase [Pseudomonas abietaniphila]